MIAIVIATVVPTPDETTEPAPAAAPEPLSYELTASALGGGRVSPEGSSEREPGAAVTLTARWTDATHTFEG